MILRRGSGFFVRRNLIATNYHVIAGAARGTAKLVGKYTTYAIAGFTVTDKTNDLTLRFKCENHPFAHLLTFSPSPFRVSLPRPKHRKPRHELIRNRTMPRVHQLLNLFVHLFGVSNCFHFQCPNARFRYFANSPFGTPFGTYDLTKSLNDRIGYFLIVAGLSSLRSLFTSSGWVP